MMRVIQRGADSRVDATVGYAAGESGHGVAYARLSSHEGDHLLRVSFRVRPAEDQRVVGFAALTALAHALRRRGVRRVLFSLDDRQLLDDLAANKELAQSMVLPYVRLRCAFNALDDVALQFSAESELTQRASAEAALAA